MKKTKLFDYLGEEFRKLHEKIQLARKPKIKDSLSFKDFKRPENKDRTIIDISPASAAKAAAAVILVIILFYFISEIRGILIIFFLSFLLAAALDPLIDKLSEWRIPRAVSVLFVYVLLFVLIGIFITKIVVLMSEQATGIGNSIGEFVTNLTKDENSNLPFAHYLKPYINQLYTAIDVKTAASQLQNALSLISEQLVNISIGLFNLIIVLILTFFMTVEEKAIEKFYLSLFPARYNQYISSKMEAIKDQIGLWLRGQFAVCVISAIISYIILVILGINYALTLAIISGVMMLIPMVGRVIAWGITFPIVFNQSPALSVWMSILYLAVQQVENNILVPFIMNKAVGLSPIIIVFAMMVGYQYLNILGLVLSIPIATTVAIFVRDYTAKEK